MYDVVIYNTVHNLIIVCVFIYNYMYTLTMLCKY
uniref:Uncharacterized protein n=1 Tax=Anguilla anguilla TaxID=7936 RepID=A0A0E9WK87_ANGAN